MSQEDVERNLRQQELIRQRYDGKKKQFDLFDTFWKVKEYEQTKRIADQQARQTQILEEDAAARRKHEQSISQCYQTYNPHYCLSERELKEERQERQREERQKKLKRKWTISKAKADLKKPRVQALMKKYEWDEEDFINKRLGLKSKKEIIDERKKEIKRKILILIANFILISLILGPMFLVFAKAFNWW